MSNDGLSTDEKVNLLFKNYMNFTSTLDSKPFYDETAVANNTNIFSNSVLSKMPSTNPSWTPVNTHQELKSLLENAGISINIDATWFNAKTSKTNSSLGAKFEHSENRALRLTRIKLDYVTNGGASFICKDYNDTNILQNLIPSNYAQNGYSLDLEYKRKDNAIKTIGWLVNRTDLSGNVYVGEEVDFGGALFDSKNGVITFYDVNGDESPSTIFSGAEFYLTATKYIGPKLTDSDGNLYIDANVGIGTDNPSEVLDVSGSIRIRKGNDLYIGDSIWDSLRFKHEGSGATGYNYIDYNNNSSIMFRVTNYPSSVSTTMTLDKDGNVGIGTNNPQSLLDLYNNTGDIMFQIRDNSTKLHIGTEEGSHAFIGVTSDDDLRLKTNNTDRMVINNVGNVGIGTTDPQKLLDLSDKFSNGFRLGETLRSSIIDVANPGALTAGYNTAPITPPSTSRLVDNVFSWRRGTVNNSNFGNIAITYLSRPGDYLKITMKVKSSVTSTFYIQNPSLNDLLPVESVSTSYVDKTLYVTIPDHGSFYSYLQIFGPDIQIKDFKIERIDMTLGGSIASTMAIVPPSNTQKFRALSLYNRNKSLHWIAATNYHFYVYDIDNNSANGDGNTRKMEICYDVDEDNTLMVFDGLNGNVGIGKMSAYPLDVTGGSRNRLLEQVGTYKIRHRRSESEANNGTISETYTPLNLFHNSDDMGSLYQNRNSIDYIAFPQATGDILYTHTIDIHSNVTGSSQVEWYKLQLRNAATGGYVDQTKFPIDSYHTIIAYKKKPTKPVIIEGDIGVDISSSDPSYENYSQLSIQSISGTVHENIMALKIGADHKTNTGYLQTVNKFIGPGHLVLQPYADNVGIGTTVPRYELDVSGSITAQTVRIGEIGYGHDHAGIKFHNLGTQSFALLQKNDGETFLNCASDCSINFQVNNDTKMIMDHSGNLGIGSNSPSAKLTVFKSFNGGFDGHYAARIYGTDSGVGETGIRICEKGGGSLNNNQAKALDVYVGGSSKMVVTGAGKVGIGSTLPSEVLDVSGNIQIQQKYTTSGIYPAGNLKFSTFNDATRWEVGAIEGYVNANAGSGTRYPGGLAFKTKNADDDDTTTATTKMVIDASGNVGIGTTDPSEVLDVSGNVRIRGSSFYIGNNFNDSLNFNHTNDGSASNSFIDYNDNGYLKFRSTPTGGSYKTTMTLDQSGNVGIGNINTSAKLTVFKSFDGGFNGHYAARIYGTDGIIGETGIRICEKGGSSLINNQAKALDVYVDGSSKMVVTGAGNVGIGTTNPSEVLDVSGNIQIQQKYTESGIYPAGNLTFSTFNDSGTRWKLGAIEGYVNANTGSGTRYPGGLAFKTKNADDDHTTAATTKMVIDASGNVGIGTTVPSEVLDVSGNVFINTGSTSSSGGRLLFDAASGGTGPNKIDLYHSSGSNLYGFGVEADSTTYHANQYHRFFTGTTSSSKTQRMTIKDGNVGIGTTVPQYVLDVSGSISSSYDSDTTSYFGNAAIGYANSATYSDWASFAHIDSNNNTGFALVQNAAGTTKLNAASSQKIQFTIDNSEKMVLDSNGNVGIGSAGPAYKLDVNGTIRATGEISANNFNGVANTTSAFFSNNSSDIKVNNFIYTKAIVNTGETGNQPAAITFGNGSTLGSEQISLITTGVTRLHINNVGNVGIGTTDSGYELDVSGSIRATDTITGNLSGNATTATKIDSITNSDIVLNNQSQTFTGKQVFRTQPQATPTSSNPNPPAITDDPCLVLKNGGAYTNATAPQIKFCYNNNDAEQYPSYIVTRAYDGSTVTAQNYNGMDFYICNGSQTSTKANENTTHAMTLTGAGRVGIATTNPNVSLDVSGQIKSRGDGSAGIRLGSYTDGVVGTTKGVAYVWADDGNETAELSLGHGSPGVHVMRLKGGNVGIGSTNPACHLDVNGNTTLAYPTLNDPTNSAFNHANVVAKFHSAVTHSGVVIGVQNGNAPYIGDLNGTSLSHQSTGLAFVTNGHTRMNINTSGNVFIAGNQVTGSDSRIKKQINDVVFDDALQTFRSIETKTYKYKDRPYKGFVYGFIAQQIKEVIPYAVDEMSSNIPNIQKQATCILGPDNKYDRIAFTDFDTANLDTSSNTLIVGVNREVTILEVIDNKTIRVDTDLSEWMGAVDASGNTTPNEVQTYSQVILNASNNVILENYDITPIASMDASDTSENVVGKMADLTGDNTIDSSGNYVDASRNTIASINADGHYIDASGNYFDADGNFKDASNNLVGTYKAEWKKVTINGTKIFVYGQKVDDFHALNKDYIFTVATAALQEVDRQLQAEKAKTATLESQVADLLARVSALESA